MRTVSVKSSSYKFLSANRVDFYVIHITSYILQISIKMDEEKKTERKRKRFAARLKRSKGITCSEVPGPVSHTIKLINKSLFIL